MKSSFRVGALSGLSKNLQLKILAGVLSDPKTELSLEVGDAPVLIDRLVNYKLDAVLSDVPIPSSAAEPLAQTEIASEAVCLVTRRKPKKTEADVLSIILTKGLYLPAHSSPITSAILDFVSTEAKNPYIRGFIDDIAFLRLLALETDSVVAIPKIGIRRELEAGELQIIHEFKKIKQSYFLVFMTVMVPTHWMALVGVFQLLGGLLVLSGRGTALGLALLAPVLVNIVAFHLFLENGGGIAPGLVFSALEVFMIYSYKSYFMPFFKFTA